MSRTLAIIAALVVVVIGLYFFFPLMPFDVWGAGLPALPTGALSRSQVFSNVIGPLSAIVAFIALIVNFESSSRTAVQTARTEQASRYQKAAELISVEKSTSQIAGIVLLEGLARESPATYMEPAAGTLSAAISELDASFKARCSLFKIDSKSAYVGQYPSASYASYEMMAWFGRLRALKVDEWPKELARHLDNGRFPLVKLYLEDSYFPNFNFSRTDFERAVLKDAHYFQCNIADSSWSFSLGGPVSLIDCDLRGVRFKIWDTFNRRLWAPSDLFTVRGGKLDGFEINGLPFLEWEKGQKLDDAVVAAWASAPPVPPQRLRQVITKRYFNG